MFRLTATADPLIHLPLVFFRQELEGTLRDPEVAELEVVGRERPYVEACGAAVRRMSADHLARGLKALNQTDIGGSLQVRDAAAANARVAAGPATTAATFRCGAV